MARAHRWLARIDGAGNQQWITQLGTNDLDRLTGIEIDGSGGFYATGWTRGPLGGGPYYGFDDAWIAHYDGAGNRTWIRQFGTLSIDESMSAAADGSGGVYVGGWTSADLGGVSHGQPDAWLAHWDSSPPLPTIYCTAKTNSLGCKPSIAMSNVPSVSASSGCVLSTANVLAHKNGLYFHGTNGGMGFSFHAGFLCVHSPTTRHATLPSGGTLGVCDGSFVEDLNSYIALGHDPALIAGAQIWIQNWSRDPSSFAGDSLSNAVTATIYP